MLYREVLCDHGGHSGIYRGCNGVEYVPVEPDYEAARKVLRTWFNGPFNGDHVLADNIVDAALKGGA